ncbi:hypothetical protein HU200_004498 [Digitaria exilis]|uniref:Aminotransferase class I/classII large domain-containing protein n=1 Tax=Digitaria exilis TaxID=1010633 RepID=A0A835FUI5_9POAL|nr:hypothetical protein HU200_004498 [Digitaria exilis]
MAAPAVEDRDVDAFLAECAPSGDAAYGAAKAVLERLHAPATRPAARRLLGAVRRRFAADGEDCFRTFHFRIHDVILDPHVQEKKCDDDLAASGFPASSGIRIASDCALGENGKMQLLSFICLPDLFLFVNCFQQRKKLTMMEIPSIFIPEDWSFTFYEGLNRHPDSIFRDKTVTELGCGNGWISIALAEKWSPSRLLFFFFLWTFYRMLNSSLVYGLDINPRAILNPNPEAMSKIITENSSEEFLYSLSNYCALQGFVEDQFGLGLIARAVEEGISVIKPSGIMVFTWEVDQDKGSVNIYLNAGDFAITKLWQTKIMQAADTDISALVEIEKIADIALSSSWILLGISLSGRADCNRGEGTVTVIEAPRQSDLLIELIRKLKPQVVVTGMAQFEAITSAAFENLLSTTKDVGSRLFLDISEHLELSSLPSSNGVLKYLAGKTLPSHAAILCGLVKNQVYSDLEVAFAISEDAAVYKALSQTIELLEGHTSLISQHYYGCLFHELLAFQIADRHPQQERQPAEVIPQQMIGFSDPAMSILKAAEFFIPDSNESSVIHMDLDRSFLPVPSAVNASVFESFVRQNITDSETDVHSSIQQLVKDSYGLSEDGCSEIISMAIPLLHSSTSFDSDIQELLSVCAEYGARVVIDTSFSGLEYQTDGWSQWNLEGFLSSLKCSKPSFSVVLLGELSFELIASGHDFGFVILNDPSLVDTFHSFPSLSRPHSTLKYTFKKLLGLKNQKDQHFSNLMVEQKELLKNRSNHLIKTLQSCGWDVASGCGGISMLAKPTAYIGKSFKAGSFDGKLDANNIREAILRATGLCINSSSWTGIPDYCRFSFALESGEFERAMGCITRFKELVLGCDARVRRMVTDGAGLAVGRLPPFLSPF